VAEARQRLPPVGAGAVPAAVAGVDFPLRAQEEDHERQVVIEVEEVQVEVINARQPDADELLGDALEAFQTDNLPVEFAAGQSRLTAQDNH
jgi:hypothetical protein